VVPFLDLRGTPDGRSCDASYSAVSKSGLRDVSSTLNLLRSVQSERMFVRQP